MTFLERAGDFVAEDGANCLAVHCKGGKGRTGVMVAAWLMYRSNTGQTLVKCWSNTWRILVKYLARSPRGRVRYWSNTGQILVKRWRGERADIVNE